MGTMGAMQAAALAPAALTWGAANAGARTLQEKLYRATHGGDPSICSAGHVSMECRGFRETMARQVALGNQDHSYQQLSAAVARCDAGKIPEPPFHEEQCDLYRTWKQEIDARIEELKKSGSV
jgi:hypothetical protein